MNNTSYANRCQSKFTEIMHRTAKFSNEENAQRFAERCTTRHNIILGDDGKYWVAVAADITRLERMGYESIK